MFNRLAFRLQLLAWLCGIALILPVNAQQTTDATTVTVQPTATQSATTKSSPEGGYTINMREADLRAFIQWVADRTQKNMIVHRSVAGTVTVISSRPISAAEAYELFLTVLQLNGFSAVENGNTVKIVPHADANTSSTPFEGRESWQGEIVTSIIDVINSDANSLVSALRPLVPASAHLAAYAPTNVIIASDSARGIEKINQLIATLDKQQGEIDLEIIPVVHASADDIVKVMDSVTKALSGGKAESAADKVKFIADKRSNSVIITGNKSKRAQIKKLIAKLDTPLEGNGNAQVVYLNYTAASEIAPILKAIGENALKDSKAENKQSVSIESSETTNALIISAPQGLMNTLLSVIGQLDIQRAQVLIEAIVVQVAGNAGDDFGIIWGSGELYDENPTGGVGAINTEANNTNLRDVIGSSLGVTTGTDTLSDNERLAAGMLSGSGVTFGYLENGNLVGALQAIASRNKSNIMSSPTIVALDNEEASLLVGQNVPFITGSSTSSGASVNNPFQTIERQDVGITLKVTPRINQGDSVTLELEQTTENVSATAVSGAADLITDKTEMKTSALIKDGQVLVIGGLIREDDVENRTQVPILGDIPLLGRLFRSHSVNKTKNNLMVFIRPTILKDQLQITGLTAQRYAFMREKQMQKALAKFIRYSDHPLLEEFETYAPGKPADATPPDAANDNTQNDNSQNGNSQSE